ncbi:MAG: hypothetical protein ACJA1N_001585 [Saprospiraceae bacterium]|jgi:hypothetical protein
MKIIEIEISGAASEIVVGSLSKEELSQIHKVMKDNELMEEEDDDGDYASFYYDSSLVDEAEVSNWHDTDNFFHQHGSHTAGTLIVRKFETKEELFSSELSDLFKKDKYGPEKNHFTKEDLGENEVMLYAVSSEKGTPFSGRIEVEDDHVFDIELLSFSRVSVEVGEMALGEIIEYMMYNDEDVDNDYYQTYGKGLELEIIEEW